MEDIIKEASDLFAAHAWVPLAALVIGLAVRLVKDDAFVAWFPVTIAPRWRSWAALGLGVISGVLNAVVGGSAWPAAIVGGLISAILAISGHDLVVEGIRKGRDFGVPKVRDVGGSGSGTPPISMKPPRAGQNVGPYSSTPPTHMLSRVFARTGYALLLVATVAAVPACAAFQKAVVPVIEDVVIVAQDALSILNAIRAAESIWFLANPDPRAQATVEEAIGDANLALDAALQAASGAKDLSANDADNAFDAFRQSYRELVALVGQLGIVHADRGGRLAVRQGSKMAWTAPLVMQRHVGQ